MRYSSSASAVVLSCVAFIAPFAQAASAPLEVAPVQAGQFAPTVAESRVFRVTQTVQLADVPADAGKVRMWVPIPGDAAWQRVLERRVVDAPAGWQLVRQPEGRGDMIYCETTGKAGTVKVVVESLVVRESPVVDLATPAEAATAIQPTLFAEWLQQDAPLMAADEKVRQLAATACAGERDPRRKVVKLMETVAEVADHYSKDPSKPNCGRGAADDCIANGGGCCTDLHSLFVALARAEGIPARLQFGHRLNPAKEGQSYDPSYRCWVEYWLDGSGWVATDIVVADGGEAASRSAHWGRLDARRVWMWENRGFDLAPKQNAPAPQTLLCGWAEIDGVPVDVLPAADKSPSKLSRTIVFTEQK